MVSSSGFICGTGPPTTCQLDKKRGQKRPKGKRMAHTIVTLVKNEGGLVKKDGVEDRVQSHGSHREAN